MGLLLHWTFRRAARPVEDALASAGVASGWIGVWNSPVLAKALASKGRRVVDVASTAGMLRRKHGGLQAVASSLPLGDGALSAWVGVGAGTSPDWDAWLKEWCRIVCDGGAIILVDEREREELTRRALCAGIVDLEQRTAARLVVTSGRVRKLPGA